jgi:hypothetical protein
VPSPTHPSNLTRRFTNTESSTPSRTANTRVPALARSEQDRPFHQTTVGAAADLSFSIYRSQRTTLAALEKREGAHKPRDEVSNDLDDENRAR